MRCRNLCINKNTENNLIQKERFLLLYKLTPIMMLANLLAGSILVGILWDAVSHITLLLWLTTLILMVILTSLFYLYLRPAYVDLEKIPDHCSDTSPERMQEISSHGLPVLHKPIKEAQLKVVIERLLRMSS